MSNTPRPTPKSYYLDQLPRAAQLDPRKAYVVRCVETGTTTVPLTLESAENVLRSLGVEL